MSMVSKLRILLVGVLGAAGCLGPLAAEAEVISDLAPFSHDTSVPAVLRLDGQIDVRTPVLLGLALQRFPQIEVLELASQGGNAYAAMAMVPTIRAAGLASQIRTGDKCHSACAFLYFAGVDRKAGGELGVHQLASGNEATGHFVMNDVIDILQDLGVPDTVRRRMMQTPPDEMYVFTGDELAALGLIGPSLKEADFVTLAVPAATEVPSSGATPVHTPALTAEPAPAEPLAMEPMRPAALRDPVTAPAEPSVLFEGHTGPVAVVAYAPDGETVLTGGQDGTARLWDASTGVEIRRFVGHRSGVNSVAFSPDGRLVLTGSWDGTARFWDAETGKEIRRFEWHGRSVDSVAFGLDWNLLLTGGWDGARLWDVAAGTEIRHLEGHDAINMHSVALSPDGRFALTGSVDTTARLWDVSTGMEIRRFEHGDAVNSVTFSPDGRFILTGVHTGGVILWEAETGAEIRRFGTPYLEEGGNVASLAFSPDGRLVLTGSWDRTARLWDAGTGAELARFDHFMGVDAVAFAPEGRAVLTAGADGIARLWPLDQAFWAGGSFHTQTPP